MKKTITILFLTAAFLWTGNASGQYFSNGQDPFSVRWNRYDTENYRLIYPRENVSDAVWTASVLDTAYRALHYGFSRPAKRLPIVLRTQNLRSNGVVVWAPKRGELIAAPPTATYANPWLKQLAVHEYRHVVQMSNLDRHVVRTFSFLLGEQAVGAAAIFVPKWFLEGDAVLAETAMAAYGRALQPEFTLAYRAYLSDRGIEQFPLDKWFCGSYRDFIPNHYYYGYQMVNFSYHNYGEGFWEHLFDRITRRPYLIFPRPIAARKHYDTSSGKLFRHTFAGLKEQWDSLPEVEETMRIIPTPTDSYTIYSHPVALSDGSIAAHKYDFSSTDRLVRVDPATGEEKRLAYTGVLSSRPVEAVNALWWTEYRASTFWEQKNRSVVRRMNPDQPGRVENVRHEGNLFYVTPYGDGLAAVSYDPVTKYAIEWFDRDFRRVSRLRLPESLTVHGMAWDAETNTLALITLTEKGMSLTGVTPGQNELYLITRPSFTAINHLTAANGKLFFNSIRSGRDESHCFDLKENKEYRITSSRFGSVMPSTDGSGGVVQATYRREGYLLSSQPLLKDEMEEITYSRLPENLFNRQVYDFGLPNLDEAVLFADARELPSKRYRKGAHLFNVHSWAPVSMDVFDAADNRNLDLTLGAMLVSQNTLSNTEAFLSYGFVNDRNWWRGGLRFLAMAPKFEVTAEYDGGNRLIYRADEEIALPAGWNDPYFSVEGRVYLPFTLSSGATLRSLVPSVSLTHENTLFLLSPQETISGYQRAEASLAYAQNRRMAYRDLAPRWGFGAQVIWNAAPFAARFGDLWSFFGNLYLPGMMQNHSLRLRGAYQVMDMSTLHFGNNVLFPRGCVYNFAPEELAVGTADYRFPIAYPDWGINELIYIKRLSANVFGGYARYNPIGADVPGWRTAHSYGGELAFDFHLLRMPVTSFTFRAAVYKTSDSNGIGTAFSLGINL